MGRAKVAWRAPLLALAALCSPGRVAAQAGFDAAIALCADRPTFTCIAYPRRPIPANGAILIASTAGEPTAVEVTGASSAVSVPGQLVQLSDQFWAWHANSPPEPGKYVVGVTDSAMTWDGVHIDFEEPTERVWPELMGAASVSHVLGTTEKSCCRIGSGEDFVDYACFTLVETRSAALHPGLSSPSSVAQLNQYLFRYRKVGESSDPLVVPWSSDVSLDFYVDSDEYCYEVEAIDLVTGEGHAYDTVQRCASHGDFEALGVTRYAIADAGLSSTVCPMPPERFTDHWCEVNEAPCDVAQAPPHCFYYRYACEGGPYPTEGGWLSPEAIPRDRLSGLDALRDQINPQTDGDGDGRDGEGGAAQDELEPRKGGDAGGCAALRPHTQASLSHTVFALFAVFVWRARARRGR